MNLLIVDDHPTNLKLLHAQLEAQGHTVFEASDGVAALARLEHERIDVVISDILMPRMDGFRLCHEIRASKRLHDLPVIIYSSTYTSPGDEKLALDVGADKYMPKPAGVETIVAALREVSQLPSRRHDAPRGAAPEAELMKEYSERLVKRLEEKNDELSAALTRLQASEARFRALVMASSDVVYRMSPDWSEMRQLDGRDFIVDTEQPSDAWLEKYIHPEDQPRVMAVINEAIRTRSIFELEHRVRRGDGTLGWTFSRAIPLADAKGEIVEWFGTASDVTERKRFEQALQETNVKLEAAKAAAEKANLAKSEFLSRMSHELRSPLNSILGFAQLMESAPPSASHTKSIAQILQAGWYLLKLIDEVLDLAVIESGKMALSKESVSLSELLSECQNMMEPEAQQRGLRMTFPRFDHPLFVSADRTRLKQIVINLVSNAIKYNREQGTVVAHCTVMDSQRTRISVRDTGAGLSPEKLAHLFIPFNRLGQEAGNVAGTGIGLVVSKRLAERMGGVLGVESTVGVGSVFWCDLISTEAPRLAVKGSAANALVQREPPANAPPRTLLYVEDNPANMKLVEELIARFPDLRLLTAVNGTLGLERARATQPQVILMDINLPGISGTKALKILREDPLTAHIPVMALSADAMPRDIEKGLEAGFFSYLTKPIKIKELMDTLNAALEFAEKQPAQTPDAGPKP